jgi:hypothetical protein
MLERLKRALVESFVGAIALGYIFAQGLQHFAWAFAAPVAGYVSRKQYRGLIDRPIPVAFSFQDALPELARSAALLVVGYVLLRWLYFKPLAEAPKSVEGQTP